MALHRLTQYRNANVISVMIIFPIETFIIISDFETNAWDIKPLSPYDVSIAKIKEFKSADKKKKKLSTCKKKKKY